MKEYYEILGLTEEESKLPWDSFQEICKKKYRTNALKFHPDRWVNGTEEEKKTAEEKFKKLNEAYSVLSDKDKRQAYDSGMDGEWHNMGASGFNPFDIFKEHFQNMGGFDFGFNFNGGFQEERTNRGQDVNTKVELTMEEANNGVTKTITYEIHDKCEHCNGTGFGNGGGEETCPQCNGTGVVKNVQHMGFTTVVTQTQCPRCGGTGKIVKNPCPHCGGSGLNQKKLKKETMTITIPVGVAPGETMIAPGAGDNPERGNGIRGNLNISIDIKMPKGYSFMDNFGGVEYVMDIPFYDAILGCEREVLFPSGRKQKIKIEPNTRSGEAYTFRNEGMKMKNGVARSSFDVVVNYDIPKKLSKKQEELLKEFKKITENGN